MASTSKGTKPKDKRSVQHPSGGMASTSKGTKPKDKRGVPHQGKDMASTSKGTQPKDKTNTSIGMRAKYQGCMVGALIGDCLGSPFERLPRRHVLPTSYLPYFLRRVLNESVEQDEYAGRRFTEIPGHPFGGHYMYTDDTAMTHALAESLIKNNGFNPRHVAESFTEEFFGNEDCRGEYGPKVRVVFSQLRKTRFRDVWEPAKSQFDGTGSYGNGAAMRVAPVALFYRLDEPKAIKVAQDQAKLTHAHRWGYNGAVLICLAIQLALTLDPRESLDVEEFLEVLTKKMEKVEEDRFYCDKLQTIKEMLLNPHRDFTPEEVADRLGNEITADRSVPAALYCFLRGGKPLKSYPVSLTSNGFLRSLYFAISLGGDTDTIGTMTGSIAGAYYGIFRIPRSMQKYCQGERHATHLASSLV
ncbi:ADP-ribose glycohydrolase ARH3 isoform X3 [Ixodes scapularis]|uniref:ADP-ribose glycohydrolase ARH3 isoform X3 n=1 Tax=Ixodes scapularis TaxID=6945 RepID=UPI001AD6B36B|nr:ADP-ribose glycohydrolase ARH3 isoform X3 [Ixodes scapularis]